MSAKDISIKLEYFLKGQGKLKKAEQGIKSLKNAAETARAQFTKLDKAQEKITANKKFESSLNSQGIALRKNGGFIDRLSGQFLSADQANRKYNKGIAATARRSDALAASAKKTKNAFAGLKNFVTGFRMELLGMGFMFSTIGIMLTTLTKKALQSFSTIGDVLTRARVAFIELQGAVKSVLFQLADSDAMEGFLRFIEGILDAFMALPAEVKETIFTIIIWGGVIATILGLMSFMLLGIFAIIAGIFAWGGALGSLIVGLKAVIAGQGIGGFIAAIGGGGGLLAVIGKAILAVISWAVGLFVLGIAFNELGQWLDTVSSRSKSAGKEGITFTNTFSKGLDFVVTLVTALGKLLFAIALVIGIVIAGVITLFGLAFDLGMAVIKGLIGGFNGFGAFVLSLLDTIGLAFIIAFKDIANTVTQALQDIVVSFVSKFQSIINIINGLIDVLNAADIGGFGIKIDRLDDLPSLIDLALPKFDTSGDEANLVASRLKTAGLLKAFEQDTFGSDITNIINRFNKADDVLDLALQDIKGIFEEIGQDFAGFRERMKGTTEATQGTGDALNEMTADVNGVNAALKSMITDVTSGGGGFFQNVDFADSLTAGVEQMVNSQNNIAANFQSVIDSIGNGELGSISIGDFNITTDLSNAQINSNDDLIELIKITSQEQVKEGYEALLIMLEANRTKS